MRVRILKLVLILLYLNISMSVFSQEHIQENHTKDLVIDSLKKSGYILNENHRKPEITLSRNEAILYLQKKIHPQYWNNAADPLRQAFGQLIFEAEHERQDSMRNMLLKYPYDSLSIPWDKFYIWEPLNLRIPVIPKSEVVSGNAPAKADLDLFVAKADSLHPKGTEIRKETGIVNPVVELKDTTVMVVVDTLSVVTSSNALVPFKYFDYPYQSDSIKAAVKSLLSYLEDRDSTMINFTGLGNSVTPMIINSKSEKVIRYWLKNEVWDSVTVWIGNPSRNTIGLYLEQGVNFRRPAKQGKFMNAKIDTKPLDNSTLLGIQHIALKSQFWKYHIDASFILNQTSLSNWVKGGENSISTALDVTGYADYNNKPLKISSSNFARLKFGYLATGKEGIRKNLDLLETNSKFNHKAFGKFDFSAIMLFKTQIAIGKNYFTTAAGNDTSNIVSKFMNPAVLTIGLGLDYQPNKTTSLNFSPLTYKGTFVTDPAYINNTYYPDRIDQTLYGVPKNKHSLNEPGVSFMISNVFKPIETVSIVNRLQLFTNYIHNPQNVDVDWEMITTARLNWFTEVRFNTHLIFDDDTKTEELKDGQPILRPDGTVKKTARIQFKEILGFSLSFKF
jgi:hypothetical protein